MGKLVDLSKMPYNLDDSQIAWVEETIAQLTDEEKVGQLFTNLFFFGGDKFSGNNYTNQEIIEKFHIGGVRYQGGTSEQVQDLLNDLQQNSKVPLLVAANCDQGGNGAAMDGTYIASGAQCDASQDYKVAHDAGYVSGRECEAMGINVNFYPCVDILMNWRNTIVNTRAYGDNKDDVIKWTSAYIDGIREGSGLVTCVKHWPGDGTEERDQHLVLGVNELQPDEWEATFGEVYRHHIANGLEMIMVGHIALPYYSKKLDPSLEDKDIMPASLAPELMNGLLKTNLDFNGLVITDASHMLGMTSAMRREDYVPRAIAVGCDMFLFFNDMAEDFGFMLKGYQDGVVTEERMTDALRRILGLKAKLNLHIKKQAGTLLKSRAALEVVGCDEHLEMKQYAADAGITLVKNTLDQLPLNPTDHRRIRLYHLTGEKGGIYDAASGTVDKYREVLESRGYEVTVNDGTTRIKGSTLKYRDEVDCALIVCEVAGYGAQNNYRIQWKTAMSNECPWYVWEVPTFMVSHNFTTHLHDATMVKCLVNAYGSDPTIIETTIDMLEGKKPFKGRPNNLVWTEKWQAKL